MFTPYHSKFFACRVALAGPGEMSLAKSLSTARVDMKPHQVDAAIFALHSPLTKGVILADEVGLGKTIEAGLVIAQRWAERRRNILLIVPASLRKQWSQELKEKFGIPSVIMEKTTYQEIRRFNHSPFDNCNAVIISSYEFAASKDAELAEVPWNLVVVDEAHRLRNVYRASKTARANKLKRALAGRFKVLLTATPFQNGLVELFGLVSIIDDDFFGNEAIFRTLYCGKPDDETLANLRIRIGNLYKRHLRKDVQAAGHVAFTNRNVITINFEPNNEEVELYEAISSYLQRGKSAAFGARPNPLMLTVARKILGSSTAAIARLLETILKRLEEGDSLSLESLVDKGDADTITEEAIEESDADSESENEFLNEALTLIEEIAEIKGYLSLARGINSNVKGDILVAQLPRLLADIVSKGGQRKVVIFTENIRTQSYLADILEKGGFNDRIVILNGANSDPRSQKFYREWVQRHVGSDAISGSKSADMKAAIIDAFKSEAADILIATESGSEGINLQFCSLIVNFDLPWNPQRVEQRIGRCHRYGQKLDVTVINFLNLRNKVEERIHYLLAHKFHLFEGVFGASDDVLGVIASGVRFEQEILKIAQLCRSDTEIEVAFAKLEASLTERINADMEKTRRRLFDYMDQGVVARLHARNESIIALLNDFERALLIVARTEIAEARFHPEDERCFDVNGVTWTTDWTKAEKQGWRFFRLGDGELASTVVRQAALRQLPLGHVVFDSGHLRDAGYPGFADIDRLRGQSGWVRVSCLNISTKAEENSSREVLVLAALTDQGDSLDLETIEHLLLTPGEDKGLASVLPPEAELSALQHEHQCLRVQEAQLQNAQWLQEENDRLDAYAEDLIRASTEQAAVLNSQIRFAKKALKENKNLSTEAVVEERKRINGLTQELDKLELGAIGRRSNIRRASFLNLERLQASLNIDTKLMPLFTFRWEVLA